MGDFYSLLPGLLRNCLPRLWCHEAPVPAGPHRYDLAVDAREIEEVLLERDPALFGIDHAVGLACPELHVEIRRPFVQDIALKLRFNLLIPYIFRVQMQILLEASGDYYSAFELVAKFSRYGQPPLVVELALEIVCDSHPFNLLVVFLFFVLAGW